MQLQGSRVAMASASAPASRVRAVQCRALFGGTKQATSEFYNFKVKVRAIGVGPGIHAQLVVTLLA